MEHFSPFFSAAFNSNFAEGKTQSMRMVDVEAKTFGLLVHWMYEHEIEGGKDVGILQLAKLWTLADRCVIPKLQNEAMDLIYALISSKDERPNNADVEKFLHFAYLSNVDTPLKRLAAHRFAYSNEKSLRCWAPRLPDGMMADIALLLISYNMSVDIEHRFRVSKVGEYLVEGEKD